MSVASTPRRNFLLGDTAHLWNRPIPLLLEQSHSIRAIARPFSAGKVPGGCETVIGDVLDRASLCALMGGRDTVVLEQRQ